MSYAQFTSSNSLPYRRRPRKRCIEDIEKYIQIMGMRGCRKLCKDRAEWKKINEKAKTHRDCNASKKRRRRIHYREAPYGSHFIHEKFEILTAVLLKIQVFWDVNTVLIRDWLQTVFFVHSSVFELTLTHAASCQVSGVRV
jgi:hypothetical protein